MLTFHNFIQQQKNKKKISTNNFIQGRDTSSTGPRSVQP